MENASCSLEFFKFENWDETSKLTMQMVYKSPADRDQSFKTTASRKGLNMAHSLSATKSTNYKWNIADKAWPIKNYILVAAMAC